MACLSTGQAVALPVVLYIRCYAKRNEEQGGMHAAAKEVLTTRAQLLAAAAQLSYARAFKAYTRV